MCRALVLAEMYFPRRQPEVPTIELTLEQQIEVEFNDYETINVGAVDVCPFKWWQENRLVQLNINYAILTLSKFVCLNII